MLNIQFQKKSRNPTQYIADSSISNVLDGKAVLLFRFDDARRLAAMVWDGVSDSLAAGQPFKPISICDVSFLV